MRKKKKTNKPRETCRNCPRNCAHINHQVKDTAPRCILHDKCPGWSPRWREEYSFVERLTNEPAGTPERVSTRRAYMPEGKDLAWKD